MTLATKAYRAEQDVIGQFITERCDVFSSLSVNASALYKAYLEWCGENEHDGVSQTRFGTYLTLHGHPSDNNASGRGKRRLGLTIKETPPPPKDDPHPTDRVVTGDQPVTTSENETIPLGDDANGSTSDANGCFEPLADDSPVSTPENEKVLTVLTVNAENPIITRIREGLLGTTVSTVSSQSPNPVSTPENATNSSKQPLANGSSVNQETENRRDHPPFCPGCEKPTTWFDRGTVIECYQCHTKVPRGALMSDTDLCPKGGTHNARADMDKWECSKCNAPMAPRQ